MAKYGEMAWEDDNRSDGGAPRTNTKDLFLRLDAGSNVVRVATKPFQYIVHKGVKKVGDKGFGQKINCSNPDGSGSCPICDAGLKSGSRWFIGVIDRKSGNYKVLDISYQVFSQIKKLNMNKVWGDPSKYDIDIFVDKNGGPTGYYSVQPNPHTPLSQSDQEIIKGADLEYLKKKTQPLSVEFVQQRLDKILEGESLFIPPPPPPKVGGAIKALGKRADAAIRMQNEIGEVDDSLADMFPSYEG